jgi:hypothetical protein
VAGMGNATFDSMWVVWEGDVINRLPRGRTGGLQTEQELDWIWSGAVLGMCVFFSFIFFG